MIKKLQKRFLIITMCSVFIVVFLIIGIINVMNYVQIDRDNNTHMQIVIENKEGFFVREKVPIGFTKMTEPGNSPEAPFSIRYFIVTYNESGEIENVNLDNIAAIDYAEAVILSDEVMNGSKNTGYKENYKFEMVNTENGNMVVFLDCTRSLWNVRQFLIISMLVSGIGIVFVFLLVLFFSKKAVAPIAESYEKQRRFITDASHELKTPLTVIGANTEVIEMEFGNSEWTASTRNQIERLSKLTENLVLLSRMDEEKHEILKEKMNLSELVQKEFEEFRAVGKTVNKEFLMRIEKNIYYKGNSEKFKKLCTILGENAIKYASDNSTIEVILKTNGKNIEMSTRNQVSFIEKGNQDVLFERFVRADSSRNSKTGGHGIGLSVAKAIVLAHKGKISAISEDGKSLWIRIIL